MAIILNGGNNPESVFYNGTALTSVWASVGGSNYKEVWSVNSWVPSTIGTMTASKGSGLQLWIRDSTLVRAWTEMWTSDSSIHRFAEYSCDITLEVDYPSREFVAGAYGGTANIQWQPSTCTGGVSVSGLPSGFSFYSLIPTYGKNLDFYKTVEGSHSTIETTIHVDCNISLNPNLFFVYGDSGIAGNYYLFTATSGFIYQNAATLRIEKTL